jgi:hypothetical protein
VSCHRNRVINEPYSSQYQEIVIQKVEKKTNKNEIEERQEEIDMLIPYQSGLEFTIKTAVRRKKSRYIHRFSSLHDVSGHGYGRRI